MTGTAYRRSAELAAVVGPYDGYARNATAHKRVMSKHAAASAEIKPLGGIDEPILAAANKAWRGMPRARREEWLPERPGIAAWRRPGA